MLILSLRPFGHTVGSVGTLRLPSVQGTAFLIPIQMIPCKRTLWIRLVEFDVRQDHALFELNHSLHDAGDGRRPFGMTEIGFYLK